MKSMEFSDWINAKFMDWCGKRRRTVTEFADYLGVKQPSVSKWMKKGGPTPDMASTLKLAARFGPEVYDVLGLVRPDQEIPFESLPTDFRRRLAEADAEILQRRHDLNLTNPDSPEVLAIAIEVFEKYGFKVTVKE